MLTVIQTLFSARHATAGRFGKPVLCGKTSKTLQACE
jgi:hypothetical protein